MPSSRLLDDRSVSVDCVRGGRRSVEDRRTDGVDTGWAGGRRKEGRRGKGRRYTQSTLPLAESDQPEGGKCGDCAGVLRYHDQRVLHFPRKTEPTRGLYSQKWGPLVQMVRLNGQRDVYHKLTKALIGQRDQRNGYPAYLTHKRTSRVSLVAH